MAMSAVLLSERKNPDVDAIKKAEYWLMGCAPGDDEPVLLEVGTKQECELMKEVYLSEDSKDIYIELFLLAVVGYATCLPSSSDDYQE